MDCKKYYEIGVEIQPMKLKNKINMNLNLEYYLIRSKYFDEDTNQDIDTFGVKIVKKEMLFGNEVKNEEECAYHLSKNRSKVEDLLQCLSKNSVTPMGLYNVLDSLIGVSY